MIGCITQAILVIFFMPIVGIWWIFSPNSEKRAWGWVMAIAGIILWLVLGVGGS